MGGADHRPLASDFVEAAQEELPEASGLLDLAEYGFDGLFSEPVAASAAGPLEPIGHGRHQRLVLKLKFSLRAGQASS